MSTNKVSRAPEIPKLPPLIKTLKNNLMYMYVIALLYDITRN